MRLGSGILSAILLAAAPAAAQRLDYGNFEGLFDEPVTSSATGKPERLSDTPVTMDIITADDIRRLGVRDIASLLRSLPGIADYRGYNGAEPFSMGALLLNGHSIYYASFNQLLLQGLPVELDEIRQIEVVRGPASALYGFNAGDGVINIVTIDPADEPLDRLMARAGNDGRRDGAATITVPLDTGIGLRMTAAGDHFNDVGEVALPVNAPPAKNSDRESLAANFSAHLGNGDRLAAEVTHTDVSARAMIPQVTEFFDLRAQSDAARFDYSADTVIGLTSLLASYNALTVPEVITPVNGWLALKDHETEFVLSDLVKFGATDTVRFAAEARTEAVHSSTTVAPISAALLAGSLMWEHEIMRGLALTNVVRYFIGDTQQGKDSLPSTYFRFQDHGLSDNSTLIYKLGPADSLRAAYTRGMMPPSQLAVTQQSFVTGGSAKSSVAGNSTLSGDEISEARLTWDHKFADLAADSRLSLYRRDSTSLDRLAPLQFEASLLPNCRFIKGVGAATCSELMSESFLSGVMSGVEAQVAHKSEDGLVWGANYSVAIDHAHPTPASGALLPDLGKNQTFHKVNANIGYGLPDMTFDLWLSYSSPITNLTFVTAPKITAGLVTDKDIVTLSPHFGWTLRPDVILDLTADNLWTVKVDQIQRQPATYYATLRWLY